MESNETSINVFQNPQCMCDFLFFVGITGNLNELNNCHLQTKDQLNDTLYIFIKGVFRRIWYNGKANWKLITILIFRL
jgi:hypothetical protein